MIFLSKTRGSKGMFKIYRKPQCCVHLLTHPRTPHFRHMSRESAPGAGGWGTAGAPAPGPQDTQHRQVTPIWLERARAGRPGPGGWGTGTNQPPRLTVSLFAIFPNQSTRSPIANYPLSTPLWGRRTSPACGSCRRPLFIFFLKGIERK